MDNNFQEQGWMQYLEELNIKSKKIISFLKKEASFWDMNSNDIVNVYKEAWYRVLHFYKKLSHNEKSFLLSFDNITYSTNAVFNYQNKKNFYIFLNETGMSYYNNKYHHPNFRSVLSLSIITWVWHFLEVKTSILLYL